MGPMKQYAERIENRVRSQGMIVDVLLPREDIPLRQILTDLSSRGTLYGIVLTPQNLEHGSLTLNILFGQPEGKRLFFFSRCCCWTRQQHNFGHDGWILGVFVV